MSKERKFLAVFAVALTLLAGIGVVLTLAPESTSAQGVRYSVFDNVRVFHNFNAVGAADFDSTVNVDGAVTYNGALDVDGATTLNNTLDVDGATTLNSTLDVDGNISSGTGAVTVTDSVIVDGGLTDIGVGSYSNANGDNDLGVAGDLEVDTGIYGDGGLDIDGATTLNSTLDVDGNVSSGTGAFTVTDDIDVTGNATLGDAADDTVSITGDMILTGMADTDAANYNPWFEISGDMTGTGTKDRNYGLVIEMTRPAGQEITNGDHDEAGLKIRVDTEAVTTTVGTVLRAIDAEAKADNPSGTVTNLYGASVTAKSDSGAGEVGSMIAFTANSMANAQVITSMMAADLRLMRQSATEPASEYVLQVRNSSTTGTGADAGIYVTSDYSDTLATDDMDYGLDMDTADVTTADIRLSNGETIDNTTDTAVQIGGFLALTEGTVIDLGAGGVITPTASYQPITNSTEGSIDTDTSTAIADGAVAGAILVICNEDTQDVVIKDAANTLLGGDVTLTGGAEDCLTLLWDGSNWAGLAMHDN